MSGGTARIYRCDTCGKEEIEGQQWQAHVIFIDRGGRPRVYELCHNCTLRISKALEESE